LSIGDALEMAEQGCDLVQREALEAAHRAGLPLTVRSLEADAPVTRVHVCARVSAEACG
jgi:aspartokinase